MTEQRTPRSKFLLSSLLLLFFSSSKVGGESASEIQQGDRVSTLPGQAFNVNFAHYAGYVTVDEASGKALFYWFFEAVETPDLKPLLLWLNGGPGCSSIGYGLAEELGPFHVTAGGNGVYWNQYSWNLAANILFLDSPVGTGFSYSNNSNDVRNSGDASTAKDSLEFLKQWFNRFPQYKGRDFYLSGESYAGHYVPQLAQTIVRYHQLTGDTSINLKGYLVGNALTDDFHDHVGISQFLWSAGLISDQTHQLHINLCEHESFMHSSEECERVLDVVTDELGNIDPYSIYTPSCTGSVTFSRNKLMKRMRIGKIAEKYDPCTSEHSTVYFNLPEVQKAIHVDPSFAPSKWVVCNGDTDSVIPVTSTRYTVDALELPTVIPWHVWYDDGQVGGRSQVYKGLTLVTVRGAGHEVPLHRPKLALILFKQFLAGSPMPTLSEHASS